MIFLGNEYWEAKEVKSKGQGLFAKKDIPAGTIIGDYIGIVIHPEEAVVDENNFYLMYYHDHAAIVPDLTKPGIHLLNHSCTPNAFLYVYRGHTLVFTLRKVFKSEELTIAYLLAPRDEFCKTCPHICKCGSPLCRKTMHLPEEKYKAWRSFSDKQAKMTKRARIRYGKELPLLSSYPDSIPDDPIYDLFGFGGKPAESLNNMKLPSVKEIGKLIRETGRVLEFSKLGVVVLGVREGKMVVSK